MKKQRLTAEEVLALSDQGFKYYKKFFQNLTLRTDDNTKCISVDSPFHDERPKSLSIYMRYGKWMFSDHAGQSYWGDVFAFVAYTKNLDRKSDFYKILEIVKEAVESKSIENVQPTATNECYINYVPDYTRDLLFKKHFGELCDNLAKTQFRYKLVESAQFDTHDNRQVTLKSDLVTNKSVYFSFIDSSTGVQFIYNPQQPDSHYIYDEQVLAVPQVFGWHEAWIHANFYCPEVAGNLIVTNSVDNVLLIQSLGYPAIFIPHDNQRVLEYFLKVLLPQCKHAYLFFDSSPALDKSAKALATLADISIIEFSPEMQGWVDEVRSSSGDRKRACAIWAYHVYVDSDGIGEYLSGYMIYTNI